MPENNHHVTLYRSDTAGNAQNCVYRHEVEVAGRDGPGIMVLIGQFGEPVPAGFMPERFAGMFERCVRF